MPGLMSSSESSFEIPELEEALLERSANETSEIAAALLQTVVAVVKWLERGEIHSDDTAKEVRDDLREVDSRISRGKGVTERISSSAPVRTIFTGALAEIR